MNERETKFQGYARLLVQELLGLRYQTVYYNDPQMLETYERIIARRAYDLVEHATEHIYKDAIYTEAPNYDKFMLAIVPDLTQWPEQIPQ